MPSIIERKYLAQKLDFIKANEIPEKKIQSLLNYNQQINLMNRFLHTNTLIVGPEDVAQWCGSCLAFMKFSTIYPIPPNKMTKR